jgi:hypothetical protein
MKPTLLCYPYIKDACRHLTPFWGYLVDTLLGVSEGTLLFQGQTAAALTCTGLPSWAGSPAVRHTE